jgi:hypothetical protein
MLMSDTEDEVDFLLAMHARGEIKPTLVELPPLPENSTEPMRRVAGFYALVAGLRAWAGWNDETGVPLACEWTGAHLGLHRMTVWRARSALVDAGVLVKGAALDGRFGHDTHAFLPGAIR